MNGRGERVERVGDEGEEVEKWESGEVQLWLAKWCAPSYALLLLRSDDLNDWCTARGADEIVERAAGAFTRTAEYTSHVARACFCQEFPSAIERLNYVLESAKPLR